MSAAAPAADAAPKKGSKKLLIIVLAVVLVLLLAGGGAAVFLMKKKAADAEAAEAEDGASHAQAPKKAAPRRIDPAAPPTFVPLDPFVVNLADRDTERYAQIGVTLKVDDPKFAEQMKPFMPAIRNNILMVIAHKSSTELLAREGKEALAEEIAREAVRPMGIEIDPPEPEGEGTKKKRRRAEVENPVQEVLFSSFIVQ